MSQQAETLMTNEWMDAEAMKPWEGRIVLARTVRGRILLAEYLSGRWFDMSHASTPFVECKERIPHFYIFENYYDYTKIERSYSQTIYSEL